MWHYLDNISWATSQNTQTILLQDKIRKDRSQYIDIFNS